MNTPSQMGKTGMTSTAAGGILSAFGAMGSGIATSSMYDYQAAIAKMNQQIDGQNAEFAVAQGSQQEMQEGLKAGQTIGQQKVAQASSGFDVNSGSNAAVRASQDKLSRTDDQIIQSNAVKTAYNFEVQGAIAGEQAQMYKSASSNALMAGAINAGSSILGGAASVSSEWTQASRVGMFAGGSSDTSAYGIGGYSSLFG